MGKFDFTRIWQGVKFNKSFFILVIVLVLFGFFIFLSASLGLQARGSGVMEKLVINQIVFGLIGGSIAGYIAYKTPLTLLKKYAVPIFIFSLVITALVFVPGLGMTHGGATRWIKFGAMTLQPAEFLKIGAIIATAAWYAFINKGVEQIKTGLGGLLTIIILTSALLLAQPDTGTPVVIAGSVGAMFLVAGGKKRHILALILIILISLTALIIPSEYRMNRIKAYLDPSANSLDIGYQTQQSMIAAGSGKLFGRGPGQSLQKFNYLPEPVGDSVFAVFAEEYGFIGAFILIILYSLLGVSGLRIASKIKPSFERLLVTGLVTMIIIQSLLNMGAMVGMVPLSGMPLIFVSHGGSALMFSLVAVGLILNASTLQKRPR